MKKIGLILIISLMVVSGLNLFTYSINAEDNNSDRCRRCHSQVDDDWEESLHEERGVDCISCHQEDMKLRKSNDDICRTCHTTNQAGKKELVKMPQKEITEGSGGFGLEDRLPSQMQAAGVTCIDCHMPDEKSHDFELDDDSEQNEACTSCHTGFSNDTIQKQIDRWQRETDNLLIEVDQLLSEKNRFKDKEAYKQAKKNYLLVRKDGSKGVHNPRYTKKLLKTARRLLENL